MIPIKGKEDLTLRKFHQKGCMNPSRAIKGVRLEEILPEGKPGGGLLHPLFRELSPFDGSVPLIPVVVKIAVDHMNGSVLCLNGGRIVTRGGILSHILLEHPGPPPALTFIVGYRNGKAVRSEEHTSELQSRGH